MLPKDYATLDVEDDKREPSRLLIEIAVRPAPLTAAASGYDAGEVQRAIRDGFREVLAQGELERLRSGTPRKSAWRWFGRAASFIICAAIGSTATLLLAASHAPRPEVVGSLTPQASAEAGAIEAASPYSQSTGAPATQRAAQVAPPAGPATFGLHEQ